MCTVRAAIGRFIACSLLKKLGLSDVINVEGGMDAIALTPIQRAQSSCL